MTAEKPTDQGVHTFAPGVGDFATRLSLQLDTPGLLFVEARKRIDRGSSKLVKLHAELAKHRRRVIAAKTATDPEAGGSAWVNVIQGVGSSEPIYGATISELIVADVLLVAAAEAFINNIAGHVLATRDAEHFDKLSPVGKWLFLPKLMKLKWQPSLSRRPLQQFAALVGRRNRVVHPKVVRVGSTAEAEHFIETLKLDAKSATEGALAVEELIRKISLSWRGGNGPSWLDKADAKKRPPCFILGTPEAGMRLGRLSTKKRRAGV